MPDHLTLLVLLVYLAEMTLLVLAMRSSGKQIGTSVRPSVSIIIAARNEERNIGSCIESVAGIDYPSNLLEIIIVDDRSTDRTAEIVRTFAERYPHIRLVRAGERGGHLKGKANALAFGVEASEGEILMFTDADCTVPSSWVEKTLSHFGDEKTGIVAGFVSLPANSWFQGIQAIDWLMLLSAASATARIDFPVTAVGNNFAIRRSAYEQVGGYRGIPFSVTEDFALFHAVTSGGKYRAVIPLAGETTILTLPCESSSALFQQRKRWFVGGRDMPVSRVLAFAGIYCFNVLVAAGFLFLPLRFWFLFLAAKLTADLLLVFPSLRKLGKISLLRYWIQFEVYFLLYVLVMPILALVRPELSWKGRTFEGKQT